MSDGTATLAPASLPRAVSTGRAATGDLTWSTVLGWSVGTIGPVTILYVVNYAGMFFMTDVLGISAGIAGSALFAVRLYDLFADPAMGIVSDRTRSRWLGTN